MHFQKRRVRALLGLFGFVMLAACVQALTLAAPHVKERREWIKAFRARMRGAVFAGEAGMVMQARSNDCGAACLKMVLAAHGIERSLSELTVELATTPRGTSLRNLRIVASRLGLPARSWVIGDAHLGSVPLPAIAFINGDHFVVIRRLVAPDLLEVDDPALGRLHWPICSFRKVWPGHALVFDRTWAP